jgi:hypothetical protein
MAYIQISIKNFRDNNGRLNTDVLVKEILSSLSKSAISDYYKLVQLSNEEARLARGYFGSEQLEARCSVEIGSIAETSNSLLFYEAIFRRKR